MAQYVGFLYLVKHQSERRSYPLFEMIRQAEWTPYIIDMTHATLLRWESPTKTTVLPYKSQKSGHRHSARLLLYWVGRARRLPRFINTGAIMNTQTLRTDHQTASSCRIRCRVFWRSLLTTGWTNARCLPVVVMGKV